MDTLICTALHFPPPPSSPEVGRDRGPEEKGANCPAGFRRPDSPPRPSRFTSLSAVRSACLHFLLHIAKGPHCPRGRCHKHKRGMQPKNCNEAKNGTPKLVSLMGRSHGGDVKIKIQRQTQVPNQPIEWSEELLSKSTDQNASQARTKHHRFLV